MVQSLQEGFWVVNPFASPKQGGLTLIRGPASNALLAVLKWKHGIRFMGTMHHTIGMWTTGKTISTAVRHGIKVNLLSQTLTKKPPD